jgi:hypothetical protein
MNIKEEFKLKYLQCYEAFQEKDIPNQLKKLSNIIRNDLINNGNNNFKKEYNLEFLNIIVIINYIKGKKESYYSNVNILDIISDFDKPIDIIVNIKDEEIDINHLLSIIIHETRHIYDIITINNNYDIHDFIKTIELNKYNKFSSEAFEQFIYLVYLSLEHELLARNNMIYPSFRWLNIVNKNELIKIFNKTFIFKSLTFLKTFDSINFINYYLKKHNIDSLINKTNNFIINVANDNNICKNKNDLLYFYKKFEDFFKSKSEEYYQYALNSIDDVINDIKNDKIYELKQYTYNETYLMDNALIIFRNFYKKIFIN